MTSPDNHSRRIHRSKITSKREVGDNIFVLRFHCPDLASGTQPGQFINIKVSDGYVPLLRRPFSVYRSEEEDVEIIFNAVGTGTTILSRKQIGEEIDVLGPLGVAYTIDDDYDDAILIAGGLGVAPLPILTNALRERKKTISTFLGARTSDLLVTHHLENISLSTDDGSRGFHGTVVDLAEEKIRKTVLSKPKIFACGPNAMLKSVAALASAFGIPAEISVECAMACGFGICQGCPVERKDNTPAAPKYYLVCKDGPVFNANAIILQ